MNKFEQDRMGRINYENYLSCPSCLSSINPVLLVLLLECKQRNLGLKSHAAGYASVEDLFVECGSVGEHG